MKYELENVSIRMVKEPPLLCDKPVNSPGRAVEVLYDLVHDMDRELLIVVNLKADMTPINMNIASIGRRLLFLEEVGSGHFPVGVVDGDEGFFFFDWGRSSFGRCLM